MSSNRVIARIARIATFSVLFGLFASLPAKAVPITGLFATGVDNAGDARGNGAADPHWSILSPSQQGIVINQVAIPSTWVGNNASSRWIWQNDTGTPVNVTRVFRLTFDLTGLDASTASLSGQWATDNSGLAVRINGAATGDTCGGFSSLCSFDVTSGFVSGINTLDFVVRDVGSIAGFLVSSISGTADELPVSAPGTVALFSLALAGVGVVRRGARRI